MQIIPRYANVSTTYRDRARSPLLLYASLVRARRLFGRMISNGEGLCTSDHFDRIMTPSQWAELHVSDGEILGFIVHGGRRTRPLRVLRLRPANLHGLNCPSSAGRLPAICGT